MFYILYLNKLYKYLIIFILFFLFSCYTENETNYIASYKDYYLTLEEAINNMPQKTKDTTSFLDKYIYEWITNKIVLNKAKLYIDENDSEITNSINHYKETLIIHKYQKELINSQFDTVVPVNQIKKYYENYTSNFILHKDIVKARMIKINNETQYFDKAKKLISANNDTDKYDLVDFCKMYAENSFLNDSTWIYLSELTQKIPNVSKVNNILLSNKNKIHSFTDDNYIYIVYIKDYQIKGNKSPLPFVFKNINQILQNQNKRKFIRNLKDKLYDEAQSLNQIKILK